MLHSILGK